VNQRGMQPEFSTGSRNDNWYDMKAYEEAEV
jgi:hypothetical protein